MWLRFKRWKYLTPLAPHVAVCASGRRYAWTGAQEGAVEVPYRTDVEELLNPVGDRRSPYEVAYEKYGIAFDATGKLVSAISMENETSTGSLTSEPVHVRRGRPPKR